MSVNLVLSVLPVGSGTATELSTGPYVQGDPVHVVAAPSGRFLGWWAEFGGEYYELEGEPADWQFSAWDIDMILQARFSDPPPPDPVNFPDSVYRLDGVDLAEFGLIPAQAPGSNLALEGFLDLAKRIGETNHPWDDQEGVEPYVSPEDIRHAARDITYYGLLEADSRVQALNKLSAFFAFLSGLDDLVTLECDLGSWQVFVSSQVSVSYLGDGWCTVTINFKEP